MIETNFSNLNHKISTSLNTPVEESNLRELYYNGDFTNFNYDTRCLTFQVNAQYERFVSQMEAVRNLIPQEYSVYCNPTYYKGAVTCKIDDIDYMKLTKLGKVPSHNLDIQDTIITKFEFWKKEFGAVLYGALGATMMLKFDVSEDNVNSIADQILDICPKHGDGTVEETAKYLLIDKGFCILYWIVVF